MADVTTQVSALQARTFARIRRRVYRLAFDLDQSLGFPHTSPFILCYHSVADDGWRFSVRLSEMRLQLTYLADHYPPLTAGELELFLLGRKQVAPCSFLITFDDGYRDVLEAQFIFEQLGISPLLFMVVDASPEVSQSLKPGCELLRGEDLCQLSAAGWEIGCHSASHADLTTLDDAGLQREMADSKLRLEAVLGKPVRYFAYPHGRYTNRVVQACRDDAYFAGFSMDDGFLSPATDLYRIPRVGVDGSHTFDEFKTLVSPTAVRLRRLIKRSPLGSLL